MSRVSLTFAVVSACLLLLILLCLKLCKGFKISRLLFSVALTHVASVLFDSHMLLLLPIQVFWLYDWLVLCVLFDVLNKPISYPFTHSILILLSYSWIINLQVLELVFGLAAVLRHIKISHVRISSERGS